MCQAGNAMSWIFHALLILIEELLWRSKPGDVSTPQDQDLEQSAV